MYIDLSTITGQGLLGRLKYRSLRSWPPPRVFGMMPSSTELTNTVGEGFANLALTY